MRKVITIDFDGCLCENSYPDIGEPHWDVIDKAIEESEAGAALILWTCRTGEKLAEAIYACTGWGLFFDEVNANLQERIGQYGVESRKISADEYWDDKAVLMDGSETDTA